MATHGCILCSVCGYPCSLCGNCSCSKRSIYDAIKALVKVAEKLENDLKNIDSSFKIDCVNKIE